MSDDIRSGYDVTHFTIRDMTECGKAMRSAREGAASMEETAGRIVRLLYEGLVDEEGGAACALVRFYKTHSYGGLDEELQRFARAAMESAPPWPGMKCLVLLATIGAEASWCSRRNSQGHQAIPLPSEEALGMAPMISSLITQLGLSVGTVVNPEPDLLLDLEQRSYNVFFVPEALGSPHVPAQDDFVVPHRIRSVLGFGGFLPWGEMFAVILFLKVPISQETANLFKPLSLNVKLAILPFEEKVFA